MAFDRPTLNKLYRYAYSLSGTEDEAYNLLQTGLKKYLESATRPPSEASVPYLRQTIRNLFIDQLRRQQRFPEVDVEDVEDQLSADGVASLENQVIAAVDLEVVWSKLGPLEREVLHLWAVEGLSAKEIAIQTGTPRNTILSRISRARHKLRELFPDVVSRSAVS